MDDRASVARLQAGDIGGLQALVERYYGRAVKAAFLVLGDKSLAEDVVQSAFLSAYTHIGTFDTSKPFGPWFLRIVTNLAMRTAMGRDMSAGSQADPGIPSPEPDLILRLEALETREEILRAVEVLSPAQRAAIVMRYYLGLSDAESSQILHVPRGTFRRRLHDAHGSLRSLLAPLFDRGSTVESPAERDRATD